LFVLYLKLQFVVVVVVVVVVYDDNFLIIFSFLFMIIIKQASNNPLLLLLLLLLRYHYYYYSNSFIIVVLGSQAFSQCSSLSAVSFIPGLTVIGEEMFSMGGLTMLKSVTIPSSVTAIGE
jgi:hypothetical protein